MATLDILAISDLHFIERARPEGQYPLRGSDLGLIWVRKAWLRLQHLGIHPDLILVLGDVVENGEAEGATEDLAAVAATFRSFGVPCLAVHGNHDGPASAFERMFETPPGLHTVNGVGLLVFNDKVGAGDVTARTAEDLRLVDDTVRQFPDLPLIALQHNPLHPAIVSDYPYMLANGDEVLAGYARAGVVAALSGHYHAGQTPTVRDGVTYFTLPALCESPFSFAHIRLEGREVRVEEHTLRLDTEPITDVHCHTEYAYCGTTVSAARCLAVSRELGVAQVCLTEHAFHLYFDKEEAWSFRWQTEPERVERAWRERSGRMDEYRRFVQSLRGPGVKLGLEVDLLADGQLLLAPEDRDGWDLFVGAIHSIPGFVKGVTTQAEAERLFMNEVERMLLHRVAVLAHPFRFFRRAGLATPVRLYPILARLLAQYGVAAEINFHTHQPDPRFICDCVGQGVRIAFGSDAHDIIEAGEFAPHIRVLEQAGVKRSDWDHVLLRLG